MDSEPKLKRWDKPSWQAWLILNGISAGIAHGAMLSPDAIKAMDDAQELLDKKKEEKDGNKRPPKPPRGRPVGRIALSY